MSELQPGRYRHFKVLFPAKTRRRAMSELQPGRYRHFKGNEYQVIGTATHSETGDTLVVYRPLYGDQALWVRPLAMFTETVERDGKVQPRFARIGD